MLMITRKFGKLLLGATIPFQLYTACILGALLGILPGFQEAPALLLGLLVLILIFNCNLFLVGLVALLSKAISLAVLPVYFSLGQLLLDGPTQGLFKSLINAPVAALAGLEYYVVTGGLLPSLVLGIVCGFVISQAVRRLQRKYMELHKGSEQFQAWANKGWVKFTTWLLLGAKPDPQVYEKLLGQRIGNPVRVIGVVVAVVFIGAIFIISMVLSGPLLANLMRDNLARANGATVDIESAELSLAESSFIVRGLAVANPDDLNTNVIQSKTITCDISGLDLLRKRLHLSTVQLEGAVAGAPRDVPGQLVGPPDEEPPPDEPAEGDVKTIEDYIAEAEKWKERLEQVQKWLEKMSGPERPEDTDTAEGKETLEDRLRRQIRLHGYAGVKASHLVDGAPTFLISELIVNDMPVKDLDNRLVSVKGSNLSTQPYLVEAPPTFFAATDDEGYLLDIRLGEAAKSPSQNDLHLKAMDLPLERVASDLKSQQAQIEGGLLDLQGAGSWSPVKGIDMPLDLTLRDMAVGGFSDQPVIVDRLEMQIAVYGPLHNPRLKVTGGSMGDALKESGKRALTDRASQELEKLGVDEQTRDQAKGLLNRFLGGGDKEAD